MLMSFKRGKGETDKEVAWKSHQMGEKFLVKNLFIYSYRLLKLLHAAVINKR